MNLSLISPEITLFLGALIILMADVFLAKKVKDFFYVSHLLSLLFCGAALFLTLKNFVATDLIFNKMFLSNSLTSFTKAVTIGLLTVVILISLKFVTSISKISAEFLALLMIATTGGMVLISANDFLTFYLGLELQALSLYLLAALNRTSAKSSEAGMKYFILGCLASGLLLFGISLIYGFSGTTNFSALMDLYHQANVKPEIPVAVMFGFILVITAMFFKISAAPFHMWSPDVYEGSATISTTFFATVAKFTAVIALLRLFSSLMIGWHGIDKVLIFAAVASLAVGSFGAIFQKNLKRLLAYSSIGHVGFILLGMMVLSKEGFTACMLYMLIYAVISLGAFGFLNLIISAKTDKESDEENDKIFEISALAGLAKTNPLMAFSLAVLMFSSAGIPPLAGFFSKFFILTAILQHGYLITAIVAVLFSVVSAYYYLRIVKIMYFDEPQNVIELDQIANVKLIIFVTALFNIIFIFFLNAITSSIANFSGL
ncbi:MAG: NADH-quinone oxidoreductase subunit N [Rickettsiales bacterium]|nr:NADH-quinone oxidoreductase subunit N [Rickettsiales bacterium]